jgi:hypothetical protein
VSINRFNTTEIGNELLRRAQHLQVDLYKTDEGDIEANFTIRGQVGQPDDDTLGGIGVAEPSDLRFLADLMKSFERKEGSP